MSEFNPSISQRIMLKAKKKVVPNWRDSLHHFSTISLALGTALQGAWLLFPADLKATWPPSVTQGVGYALAIILAWGLVGKFLVQGPPQEETKP